MYRFMALQNVLATMNRPIKYSLITIRFKYIPALNYSNIMISCFTSLTNNSKLCCV